ncbi:MAG: MerR family transcriptional regulator [Clostridiales bacterium]|nr:MerR family transcriptional regulator [Clostridiales bacterium]
MNIHELEKRTGVTKQNIRFYEKKELLHPSRNSGNNYREYTEEDVQMLQIIKILRKLDISIEDIRTVLDGQVPLERVMKKQLETMQEKQKELDAGIRICQSLLHTELEELDPDQVLQKMDELERKGGRFMEIINDYKKVARAEHQKEFSFMPDTMVQNKREFTEALLQYAEENNLNLVITKESMYPVFEIDGVEYTAWREFRKTRFPAAVIHCTMTHPEEADAKTRDVPKGRKMWMRFFNRYMAVIFVTLFLLLTERPLWLAAVVAVGTGPIIYWTCRGR